MWKSEPQNIECRMSNRRRGSRRFRYGGCSFGKANRRISNVECRTAEGAAGGSGTGDARLEKRTAEYRMSNVEPQKGQQEVQVRGMLVWKSEPQNIECRMSNRRRGSRRFRCGGCSFGKANRRISNVQCRTAEGAAGGSGTGDARLEKRTAEYRMSNVEPQKVERGERLNWEEVTGVEDFGKPGGVNPKAQDYPSSLDILRFDILRFAF